MKITLEYIWIDINQNIRAKTKVWTVKDYSICDGIKQLPLWNFDGSSTGQAEGKYSEIVLKPCAIYKDPFRRNKNSFLVLCECYDTSLQPLKENTRYQAQRIFENTKKQKPWYGLEQEYVLYNNKTHRPLGWPKKGYPEPQGKYYCGVGTNKTFGRQIVEEHLEYCLYSELEVSGINAEVMPGQWEYQIGPCVGIEAGDQMWISRYILERICEKHNVIVSFDPKPEKGDWNGSGCHINYSSEKMRQDNGLEEIHSAIKKLRKNHMKHIAVYGDNTQRLTGKHETSRIDEFTYGVSDRTASIRIPLFVNRDKKGYLEDRRPASDVDPYLATSMIAETTLL